MNDDSDNDQGYVISNGRVHLLADRVLIIPDKIPERSAGGIIIPDSVRDAMAKDTRVLRGRLVAMGPGMMTKWGWRWPMPDCRVGSYVYYGPNYGGNVVTFDGVVHLIIREDYVHAVEDESAAAAAE